MSTQPSLQTPDQVLEAPLVEAPTKGLIPRSGLFLFIGLFVLMLIAFAAYDLTKSPAAPPKAKDAKDKTGTPMTAVNASPPPPATDIADIARAQGVKADQAVAAQTRIAENANKQPLPAGTVIGNGATQPRPGMILPKGMSNPDGSPAPTSIETASDQREAAAAVSGIFAMTGGGEGVAGALGRMGVPGSAEVESSADPVQRQIDALTKTLNAPNPGADAPFDVAKMLTGLQGGQKTSVSGKDQSWLKESANETVSEAVYAKTPASPWMLFQGTRVPIVLREEVNSDLPGSVTAMSTSPVYDSINQCAVLIPPGTKFFGAYSADIRPGQSRVLFAFRRMILPDGRSVVLDGAQAVDQRGAAGAEGDVNNHFLQMYGYGFAIALLSSAGGSGGANVTTTDVSGKSTTTTIAGQVLADIGGKIMSRNAVIPPTIKLDIGSRMFLTIVRDIALAPTSRNHCK